jgi:hypothetical protein
VALKRSFRFQILRRDNFTCRYCGRSAPDVVLEVDHVIPRSRGGKDHASNLVTACFDCNQGKSATELTAVTLAVQDEAALEEFGFDNYSEGCSVGEWRAWIVARHLAASGWPFPERIDQVPADIYNEAFDLFHMSRPHDHAKCAVSW